MARKRLQQSTADYLAIAISPVLIMLLVGSLVFFFQEISYSGQYVGRVRWMLGWFVFATVLISRIGIEFGKSYASMYAGALALACAAFASRFLEEYIIGTVILMGIVWWCVDKLTWDCTVIDDSVQVTSAGLLQQSGMDRPPEEPVEDESLETEKQRKRRLRREQLGITETRHSVAETNEESEQEPPSSEKQHSPGVWVVYFSLGALPLFGVGQAFLPQEGDSIREGFLFLWVYVASALGLFLTTSFLGLRRYLRQRRLKMPTSITAAWVTSGAVIVFLVLGLCLLIPRPHAGTSVTALLDRFVDDQSASNIALSSDDAGEGEGRRVGKVDENSEDPGDKLSEKGAPTDAEGDGRQSGSSNDKGKSQGGEQQQNEEEQGQGDKQQSENQQQAENQNQNNPGQQQANSNNQRENTDSSRPPSSTSTLSQIAPWLKWAVYTIFGIIILIALWKNLGNLITGAQEFWQSVLNFWSNLFGTNSRKKRKRPETGSPIVQESEPRPKSFAEYENPFATGLAHRMSPDALVFYSEEALRAFAQDLGIETGQELTPVEIGQEVTRRIPELVEAVRFLTTAHSRILYSSQPPSSFEIAPLENLWNGMTRREPQTVG